MVYVVCQTSKCQQTYPMDYFGEINKDTKDISCKKCGGVLVDSNGKANFSRNSDVRPVITLEEIEEQRRSKLKEKKQQLKELQKEIRELKVETY